jgi:hypothetical protein
MLASLEMHKGEIGELCRRYGVRRLDVFGSASRDEPPNASSDIDLLADFDERLGPPALSDFLALRQRLADLLGRPVDLVMNSAVRNPYIRASIDRTRRMLHGA